jgi:hypothetical protein
VIAVFYELAWIRGKAFPRGETSAFVVIQSFWYDNIQREQTLETAIKNEGFDKNFTLFVNVFESCPLY